jgi:hypothetical protein
MAAFCEAGRVRSSRVCSAKGGVHNVHTFVHGPLFDLHFDPFLVVLPTPLHAGLCCRQHGQTLGFLGRPGFSGNVFGVIYGRRAFRRQSGGVWDPGSSSGAATAPGAQGVVACLFVHLRGQCGPRLTCPA